MKIAVNENMDRGFEKLRAELARKDLTDQRFGELERRMMPLEEERRAAIRRAIQRDEETQR